MAAFMWNSLPWHYPVLTGIAMRLKAIIVCAVMSLVTADPAFADDRRRSSISQAEAIRIARGYGMVRILEVERDDGGWEIEGRDHRGRKLEITINREGRVTSVERGDDEDD